MSKETEELRLLVKQLDKIIMSERAEVKEAFRELLIMSTLISSDDVIGPLTQLTKDIDDLKYRTRRNEQEIDLVRSGSRQDREYGRWATGNPYRNYTTGSTDPYLAKNMQNWCNEIFLDSNKNLKDDDI